MEGSRQEAAGGKGKCAERELKFRVACGEYPPLAPQNALRAELEPDSSGDRTGAGCGMIGTSKGKGKNQC